MERYPLRKPVIVEGRYDKIKLDSLFVGEIIPTDGFRIFKEPGRLALIRSLAAKTGIYGMIGGQTVDVELTDRPVSREQLDFIYHLKTGALLEASMMIGAVLAGADEKVQKQVEQMASDIGMAFQIQDDILDVEGDAQVIGKPVKSDEKNNKTTYVTLYGPEGAKEQVKEYSRRAVEILDHFQAKDEFLRQLIISLITRDR